MGFYENLCKKGPAGVSVLLKVSTLIRAGLGWSFSSVCRGFLGRVVTNLDRRVGSWRR